MIKKTIHDQTQRLSSKKLTDVQLPIRIQSKLCHRYIFFRNLTMNSNGVEKRLHNDLILIDLQKAFDTLHHKILLDKIKRISFTDKTIKLFHSYLLYKISFVSLDNIFSEAATISCGVTQSYLHKDLCCFCNM